MGEKFVGRSEEMSQVLRTIRLGESSVIVSPNGMGKSSLLAELARRNASEFVFVPIDLTGITDESTLLNAMTRGTMKAVYGNVESFKADAWEVLVNQKLRRVVIDGIKPDSVRLFGARFVEFSAQKMIDREAEEKPTGKRPDIRMCPTCGGPLKWIEKYSKHYCYRCKRYAPVRRTVKLPVSMSAAPPLDEHICPRCRNELQFVHKYSEYYCDKCDRYPMIEFRKEAQENLTPTDVAEALDLPERIANQKATRAVVMLDEFQEIQAIEDPAILDTLRERFEMHGNVSYIFAGNNRQLLSRIFQEKDSPFSDFAYWLEIEPISEAILQRFLMDGFASAKGKISKDATELIVGVSGGIPYYVQKIAHELFHISPSPTLRQTENAIDSVVKHRSPMYSVLWESVRSPLHRKYLLAVANEPKIPHGEDFVRRHGLRSRSHVQRTEKQLEMRGIIRNNEIVDPIFVLWLRSTAYS